jgi:5-methyltetrahydrofolate--homocysteine methyltransferase
MSVMDDIRGAVVSGDKAGAKSMMEQVLADGANPTRLLNSALISAMTEVGERFEHKDLFLPEMLIAARAMKGALAVLEPHLRVADVQPVGRILLATVSGDMHDIGKNVVGIMMEGAGFEVIDLGVDVAPERIVAMVKEYKPDLVGLSALLTTTMEMMPITMEALNEAGIREQVKVIVGGAPVTQKYATSIGADLYAPDAASAARVSVEFLSKRHATV